jgi:S-adenosylmethionine/arginine decarboxylase-like enzyme
MRWGFHLALDIAKCLPPAIRCPKHIDSFTKKLVKEIDMKAYGEPQIVMFGEGNKKGYTLVQLIETSNITAHFCEETNDMYLDIFSCKPFDKEKAKRMVEIHFQPKDMKEHYFERQAPYVSLPDLP